MELETANSNNRLLQYNNTVYKPAQVVRDTENSNSNNNDENNSDSDDDDEIGAMIYRYIKLVELQKHERWQQRRHANMLRVVTKVTIVKKKKKRGYNVRSVKSGEGCLPR